MFVFGFLGRREFEELGVGMVRGNMEVGEGLEGERGVVGMCFVGVGYGGIECYRCGG